MADNIVSMPVQNTVSVGNLGLSVRAVNALKQAGIHTYDKLQELSWEELLLIPKLGQVTASEIYRIITAYKKGLTFTNQDQLKVRTEDRDLNIKVLNLGPRAQKGLKSAQIDTFGELEDLGTENLLKIRGIGKSTVQQIIQSVSMYYNEKDRIQDLAIENLDLGNRSLNALRRNNILYVSQLKEMTIEEISVLRGIGHSSLEEIVTQMKEIVNIEIISCLERTKVNRKQQLGEKPVLIDSLDLSTRALNALKESGFMYVDEIIDLKKQDFLALKNIGERSVHDIEEELKRFQTFNLQPEDIEAGSLEDYIAILQKPLSRRQKDILNRRLGFYSVHAETLENIAKDYNLSRERVRQIEKTAKKKMYSPTNRLAVKPLFSIVEEILAANGGVLCIGELTSLLLGEIPAGNLNAANVVPIIIALSEAYEVSEGLWALPNIEPELVIEIQSTAKDILYQRRRAIYDKVLQELVIDALARKNIEAPINLIESCLKYSKSLNINKNGYYSLAEWDFYMPKNRTDYVQDVLKSLGRPAHYKEITQIINAMLPKEAQYSAKSIQVVLGSSPLFIRVGTGTYALVEER